MNVSIFIKHQLDTTNFETLRVSLEQLLNAPVQITDYDSESPYYQLIPKDYTSWVLNVFHAPDYVELYSLGSDRRYLFIRKQYVDVGKFFTKEFDFKMDEWEGVLEWMNPRHFLSKYFAEKRKYIYTLLQLFGAKDYLLFDTDKFFDFANDLGQNDDLPKAIENYQLQSKDKFQKDEYLGVCQSFVIDRQVKIGSIHEFDYINERIENVYDWYKAYSYIFVDDFRDYKTS